MGTNLLVLRRVIDHVNCAIFESLISRLLITLIAVPAVRIIYRFVSI